MIEKLKYIFKCVFLYYIKVHLNLFKPCGDFYRNFSKDCSKS